ncbi:MAG TPA: hypothetical protein PK995_08625 [Bacteroidia bacterium]|nr:hypothetical protein [Bacteroidia bacterium]
MFNIIDIVAIRQVKYKVSNFVAILLLSVFINNSILQFICLCGSEKCSVISIKSNHHLSKSKKHTKPCCAKKSDHQKNTPCSCEKVKETSFSINKLPKLISHQIKVDNKKIITLFHLVYSLFVFQDLKSSTILVDNFNLPPPKVPDIRIFIQSFTL